MKRIDSETRAYRKAERKARITNTLQSAERDAWKAIVDVSNFSRHVAYTLYQELQKQLAKLENFADRQAMSH